MKKGPYSSALFCFLSRRDNPFVAHVTARGLWCAVGTTLLSPACSNFSFKSNTIFNETRLKDWSFYIFNGLEG
ncbi:hypothetical protein NIASO_04840 [Niabella soli DSM 19437]|uniref:Uncharacterized protein n=1 Tax=Niabella soli DSM 19437 TaxID=929713 RepID=W0F7D6_9BACT|nr:hypothetical protein NIASO_04840 [Niabella soli DSM 19437]